jgi:Ino eighty subunit 2
VGHQPCSSLVLLRSRLVVSFRKLPRLSCLRLHIDVDIESEDEDDDAEAESSTLSSGAGPSTKPLTARQAALASVVGPSHVSLCEFLPLYDVRLMFLIGVLRFSLIPVSLSNEPSRKKKQLNEAEIALQREETARKRKNMTEKKLEDEKVRSLTSCHNPS